MTGVFRLSTTSWKLVFSHLSRRHGKHAFTISSMGLDIPTGWALVHERVGPRCSGGVRLRLWPPAVVGAFTGLSARVVGGAGVGAEPASGPMRTTRLSPQSSRLHASLSCTVVDGDPDVVGVSSRHDASYRVWYGGCGSAAERSARDVAAAARLRSCWHWCTWAPPSDGRTAVTPLPRSIPHGFGGGFSKIHLASASARVWTTCQRSNGHPVYHTVAPSLVPRPSLAAITHTLSFLPFFLMPCNPTPLTAGWAPRNSDLLSWGRSSPRCPVVCWLSPTAPNRLLAASCPSREQPAAHPVARACDPRLQIRHAFRLASHEAGEGACAASCVAVVVLNARSAGSVTPSKWP